MFYAQILQPNCVLSYAQIPCVATRLSQLLFPATATATSDHCTDNSTCTSCHVRSPLNGTLSFAALVLSSLHALAWSDSLRMLVYTAAVPTGVSTVPPLLWHSFRRLTVRQCRDINSCFLLLRLYTQGFYWNRSLLFYTKKLGH